MAAIMMLIDTAKCIGCKACQVACKQWHQLPVEPTSFTGSYTNPPDLSGKTFTFVNYQEIPSGGKLLFTFLKRQCLHCNKASCQTKCTKGVEKTSEGFVVFNDNCTPANVRISTKDKKALIALGKNPEDPVVQREYFLDACPYKVSRYDEANDKFVKCDMCFDRMGGPYTTFRDGKPTTACELTCPVGAIVTDSKGAIMAEAKARLAKIKTQYPKATLWGGRGRVIFILTENPANYQMDIGGSTYKLGNYGLVSV